MGRVLVVDDSRTVLELHRRALESAGFRVSTAQDGLDALSQLARDRSIQLVVTDLEMDEMDGLMLTEAIRSQGSLPVVVVTSNKSEEHRRQVLAAGADAYIVKHGFSGSVLLRTVERLLGSSGLHPDISLAV